jgi:hypothetical protein
LGMILVSLVCLEVIILTELGLINGPALLPLDSLTLTGLVRLTDLMGT